MLYLTSFLVHPLPSQSHLPRTAPPPPHLHRVSTVSSSFQVHFRGWSAEYDEWIGFTANRLKSKPIQSVTRNSLLPRLLPPTPPAPPLPPLLTIFLSLPCSCAHSLYPFCSSFRNKIACSRVLTRIVCTFATSIEGPTPSDLRWRRGATRYLVTNIAVVVVGVLLLLALTVRRVGLVPLYPAGHCAGGTGASVGASRKASLLSHPLLEKGLPTPTRRRRNTWCGGKGLGLPLPRGNPNRTCMIVPLSRRINRSCSSKRAKVRPGAAAAATTAARAARAATAMTCN